MTKARPAIAMRLIPPAAAMLAAACAEFSTRAVADVFQVRPVLIVEQIFTDNVRSSSSDRDADGVTSLTAHADALLRTSRIEAAARAEVYYNEFWATDEFDAANFRGIAAGRLRLFDDVFFLDGTANRQQVFLRPGGSASGLATGQDLTEVTNYSVSPYLETAVLDLVDVAVRATYAQVFFDKPVTGPLVPLNDLTEKAIAGRISTGERSSFYQLIGTAEYIETDADYRQRNAVGSVILNFFSTFSAIGRIGYERISDPTLPVLRGPVWSAGGRYKLGKESLVHAEYGHRYGGVSWLGEVNLTLSPRLRVGGDYTDVFTPAQLTLTRSITDLFDANGHLSIPDASTPGIPNLTTTDLVIREKDASLSATYTVGLRSYEFSARHTDRFFPSIADSEKLYGVDFVIREQLSRRLSYTLDLNYFDLYDARLASVKFQNYQTNLSLTYLYTDEIQFRAGYLWRLQAQDDNVDRYENVLRFSVSHAF